MNSSEKYTPSEEDIKQTESMMTDEQREASEIRARNWEQEQPPWEDFSDNIDKNLWKSIFAG